MGEAQLRSAHAVKGSKRSTQPVRVRTTYAVGPLPPAVERHVVTFALQHSSKHPPAKPTAGWPPASAAHNTCGCRGGTSAHTAGLHKEARQPRARRVEPTASRWVGQNVGTSCRPVGQPNSST